MFSGAAALNQNIGNWDTRKVSNMYGTFFGAAAFNQDIGSWDTSQVTDMSDMFEDAVTFNQPIGSWDTRSVTDMSDMFEDAASFDQDLSGWCVSKIDTPPIDFDKKPPQSGHKNQLGATAPKHPMNNTNKKGLDHPVKPPPPQVEDNSPKCR